MGGLTYPTSTITVVVVEAEQMFTQLVDVVVDGGACTYVIDRLMDTK